MPGEVVEECMFPVKVIASWIDWCVSSHAVTLSESLCICRMKVRSVFRK